MTMVSFVGFSLLLQVSYRTSLLTYFSVPVTSPNRCRNKNWCPEIFAIRRLLPSENWHELEKDLSSIVGERFALSIAGQAFLFGAAAVISTAVQPEHYPTLLPTLPILGIIFAIFSTLRSTETIFRNCRRRRPLYTMLKAKLKAYERILQAAKESEEEEREMREEKERKKDANNIPTALKGEETASKDSRAQQFGSLETKHKPQEEKESEEKESEKHANNIRTALGGEGTASKDSRAQQIGSSGTKHKPGEELSSEIFLEIQQEQSKLWWRHVGNYFLILLVHCAEGAACLLNISFIAAWSIIYRLEEESMRSDCSDWRDTTCQGSLTRCSFQEELNSSCGNFSCTN